MKCDNNSSIMTYQNTKLAIKALNNKLQYLLAKQKDVIQQISRARAAGDVSENFELKSAKQEQFKLEYDIQQLQNYLSVVVAINIPISPASSSVQFGCKVKLIPVPPSNLKTKEYVILGLHESDACRGSISYNSPLIAPILNKTAGYIFSFNNNRYKIESITIPSDEEVRNVTSQEILEYETQKKL